MKCYFLIYINLKIQLELKEKLGWINRKIYIFEIYLSLFINLKNEQNL